MSACTQGLGVERGMRSHQVPEDENVYTQPNLYNLRSYDGTAAYFSLSYEYILRRSTNSIRFESIHSPEWALFLPDASSQGVFPQVDIYTMTERLIAPGQL